MTSGWSQRTCCDRALTREGIQCVQAIPEGGPVSTGVSQRPPRLALIPADVRDKIILSLHVHALICHSLLRKRNIRIEISRTYYRHYLHVTHYVHVKLQRAVGNQNYSKTRYDSSSFHQIGPSTTYLEPATIFLSQ